MLELDKMEFLRLAKLRSKRFLISLIARLNSRNGIFAIEIRNSNGLGAKLAWCLEIMAYCNENGLIPRFRFSYPNSEKSEDYFDRFFRINGAIDENKQLRFIKISSIIELDLGKDYDYVLNIDLATYLLDKYLIIRECIIQEVESFCSNHFNNRKVLGVHYRGTDKVQESPAVPYDSVRRNIEHYLRLSPETDCIFIATDDMNFIESIDKAPMSRPIIYRSDAFRSRDNNSIHKSTYIDKYQINRDAIVNCLILSQCDALIKTASILSAWSKLFNPRIPTVMLNKPYSAYQWFPERELIKQNLFEPIR